MDLTSLYDAITDGSAVDLFNRLNRKRLERAAEIRKERWWNYYDNDVPLAYLARILAEQENRFPPLRLAWGTIAVDAVWERLAHYGFRLGPARRPGPLPPPFQVDTPPTTGDLDDELLDIWQANDMDEQGDELHLATLAAGDAYLMVGPPEYGGAYPRISVEYPDQVAVARDPLTRRVIAAIKVYRSDETQAAEDRALLMVPGANIGMILDSDNGKGWQVETRPDPEWADGLRPLLDLQSSPLVPIAPALYKPRRGLGQSAIKVVREPIDAVNQTATNLLAAVEHHAVPRRYAVGLSQEDFIDEHGKPLPVWKIATGPVWSIPYAVDDQGQPIEGQEIKVGQFPSTDLRNFHETVRMLALAFAAIGRLPADYMGYISDNPASEAAIRAGQDRLIRGCEKAQGNLNPCHETAARIVLTALGRDPGRYVRLESVWMNPATPTMAARIDAAVKAVGGGPVIDQEQAWEDIGYTPTQQQRMRERMRAAGAGAIVDDAVNRVRRLELAPTGPGGNIRDRITVGG